MKPHFFKSVALLIPLSLAATQHAFGFAAGADAFASATVISSENENSASTDLLNFTVEAGEPGHGFDGAAGAQRSAWWSWTATQNGFCTVDTLLIATTDYAIG